MSKPRELWWGFVRAIIRKYPEYLQDLADLHTQSITAAYGESIRGGRSEVRTVETLALRNLPSPYQQYYEAVANAIDHTIRNVKGGRDHVELIRLEFWEHYTLQGAAMKLNISYDTAVGWQNRFIRTVAKNMGLAESRKHT